MTYDNMIYAVPVGGLKVRTPNGRGHLPPEGGKIVLTPYWRRRAAENSVALGATLREAQAKARETASGLEPGGGKAPAKAASKSTTAKEG
ncbi:MAG: hypothetical protein COW30_00990 [Rhodospirillales bacterium CG15_BIG_FIL_POST_REV_8_21_14_020_66_15]|nr:MAG: hypothetical protein COW30_00990 [Rhodospirillales bacterium CG15_BIG_FIL_POST_REV_8_21_14_020_66_15]